MCTSVRVPKECRIEFGYSGAGVTGGCELPLPDMDAENSGPLQEQYKLLIHNPYLQVLKRLINYLNVKCLPHFTYKFSLTKDVSLTGSKCLW